MAECHSLVEQKDFDVLGTVREQLNVDLGITAGAAIEHRSGKIGIEALQDRHQPRSGAQQMQTSSLLFLVLEQALVDPQLGLDFAALAHGGPVFHQVSPRPRRAAAC